MSDRKTDESNRMVAALVAVLLGNGALTLGADQMVKRRLRAMESRIVQLEQSQGDADRRDTESDRGGRR